MTLIRIGTWIICVGVFFNLIPKKHFQLYAMTALLCFSFAVGLTGDVRWLRAKPEMAAVKLLYIEAGAIPTRPVLCPTDEPLICWTGSEDGAMILSNFTYTLPNDESQVGLCPHLDEGIIIWGVCVDNAGGGSGVMAYPVTTSGTLTVARVGSSATDILAGPTAVRYCSDCDRGNGVKGVDVVIASPNAPYGYWVPETKTAKLAGVPVLKSPPRNARLGEMYQDSDSGSIYMFYQNGWQLMATQEAALTGHPVATQEK